MQDVCALSGTKRIVVFGGAGFVGSALVRRPVREGHDAPAFSSTSSTLRILQQHLRVSCVDLCVNLGCHRPREGCLRLRRNRLPPLRKSCSISCLCAR